MNKILFNTNSDALPPIDKILKRFVSFPLQKGFLRRKVDWDVPPCNHSNDQWSCGDNIVGIIGPQTSAVSLEIASLGRMLKVPLVSYLSTSVTLCQREQYPSFFRTVPSDKHQVCSLSLSISFVTKLQCCQQFLNLIPIFFISVIFA